MRHHRFVCSSMLCASLVLAACGQSDSANTGTNKGTHAKVEPHAALSASAPASASKAGADFASDAATLELGASLYQKNCFACHDTGAAGAPKRGDKAAWAPRLAQGSDVLYHAALTGIKAMPPRGGSGASDAEVKAAVDYIVAASR